MTTGTTQLDIKKYGSLQIGTNSRVSGNGIIEVWVCIWLGSGRKEFVMLILFFKKH